MHAHNFVLEADHEIRPISSGKEHRQLRLDALRFALSGGLYLGIFATFVTVASMMGVPGFPAFTQTLTEYYGAYGYSATWPGVLIGGFWGFVEGFVHLGLFALLYNRLLSARR